MVKTMGELVQKSYLSTPVWARINNQREEALSRDARSERARHEVARIAEEYLLAETEDALAKLAGTASNLRELLGAFRVQKLFEKTDLLTTCVEKSLQAARGGQLDLEIGRAHV